MARFIAAIEGNRGEATRLGTPDSGIRAQAQGWNVGVQVLGNVEDDADEFDVWATSGSIGARPSQFIGTVRLDEDGNTQFIPATP
jgi:hypothetical protein